MDFAGGSDCWSWPAILSAQPSMSVSTYSRVFPRHPCSSSIRSLAPIQDHPIFNYSSSSSLPLGTFLPSAPHIWPHLETILLAAPGVKVSQDLGQGQGHCELPALYATAPRTEFTWCREALFIVSLDICYVSLPVPLHGPFFFRICVLCTVFKFFENLVQSLAGIRLSFWTEP